MEKVENIVLHFWKDQPLIYVFKTHDRRKLCSRSNFKTARFQQRTGGLTVDTEPSKHDSDHKRLNKNKKHAKTHFKENNKAFKKNSRYVSVRESV